LLEVAEKLLRKRGIEIRSDTDDACVDAERPVGRTCLNGNEASYRLAGASDDHFFACFDPVEKLG